MKAMYRAALVVAVFVFLLPLSARSEIKAGSFELTPFGGYNLFESQQNLEDQFLLGGRIGYNFTKNFGIEGSAEFMGSHVNDKTQTWTRKGQFTSPIDSVDVTFYHLDLVYHFMPEGNFNPFIVAGYGAAHYSPEVINDKNMSVIDFGLGAKYWVADNIALRFDLRDNMVWDEKIHNIQAMFGIVFSFGGKAKPEPTPVAKVEPKAAEPIVILASEPKAEEKVAAVVSEPAPVVLAFEDIHFDFDKATLKPEAQAILKRSIQLLKDNPKAKVRIAGYTSASGTKEYNQKLSERRAKAVYDYLTKEGLVPPDRLTTIGYGEMRPGMYEPIPENLYSTQAKANMRVLFEVIVK